MLPFNVISMELKLSQSVTDIILWDLKKFTTKLKVKAHTSAIWAVAFSPDSQTAFTAGSDQIIREWDLSNGESISP